MRRSWTKLIGLIVMLSSPLASAAPCLLMRVKQPSDATLKVYFTKFIKEDNTSGKYRQCRMVSKNAEDVQTFFVTPFRQDASVVVHPSNWPQ